MRASLLQRSLNPPSGSPVPATLTGWPLIGRSPPRDQLNYAITMSSSE